MSDRLRVVPYTWNPETDPVDGIALMRGQFVKAFIPMDRAIEIADRLVDIYEQNDRTDRIEQLEREAKCPISDS